MKHIILIVVFYLVIGACNNKNNSSEIEQNEQSVAAGSWIKESDCNYVSAADSFVIKISGDKTFNITVYESQLSGFKAPRSIAGELKVKDGRTIIETTEPGYGPGSLIILPETNRIHYDKCYYSKK